MTAPKAGIQGPGKMLAARPWIPAFAGMTRERRRSQFNLNGHHPLSGRGEAAAKRFEVEP